MHPILLYIRCTCEFAIHSFVIFIFYLCYCYIFILFTRSQCLKNTNIFIRYYSFILLISYIFATTIATGCNLLRNRQVKKDRKVQPPYLPTKNWPVQHCTEYSFLVQLNKRQPAFISVTRTIRLSEKIKSAISAPHHHTIHKNVYKSFKGNLYITWSACVFI